MGLVGKMQLRRKRRDMEEKRKIFIYILYLYIYMYIQETGPRQEHTEFCDLVGWRRLNLVLRIYFLWFNSCRGVQVLTWDPGDPHFCLNLKTKGGFVLCVVCLTEKVSSDLFSTDQLMERCAKVCLETKLHDINLEFWLQTRNSDFKLSDQTYTWNSDLNLEFWLKLGILTYTWNSDLNLEFWLKLGIPT